MIIEVAGVMFASRDSYHTALHVHYTTRKMRHTCMKEAHMHERGTYKWVQLALINHSHLKKDLGPLVDTSINIVASCIKITLHLKPLITASIIQMECCLNPD